MRFATRGLLTLWICASMLGSTCLGGTGGTGFPRTAEWTARTVNTGAALRPVFVTTFDFDSDSKLDIAAAYQGEGANNPAVFIFFQTDPSTFVPLQLASSTDLAGVTRLALGDLDGDSHQDVVAACNGKLVYLHSPTDPRSQTWTASIIAQSDETGFGQWSDVAIGQIDGASGSDIVACNSSDGRVAWFRSPASSITTGTGWTRTDIAATGRTGAAGIALENLDADGDLDVISTAPQEGSAQVAWYRNPTDPTISGDWNKFTIGSFGAAERVIVANLNGDGFSDVVAVNNTSRQIGWYRRPSDATTVWTGFAITVYNAGFTPFDVAAAFVDNDNQIDIIAATRTSATLRWFRAFSDQTQQWSENNLDAPTLTPFRIATGDINGNGRPDLVVPFQGSTTAQDKIVWYENPEP